MAQATSSARSAPPPAGILLTGGASRRMGTDKARLRVGGVTLAERVASVLAEACTPCVEVGPGRSGLPAVQEVPPRGGPLAALVAGWHALRVEEDHHGPVVALAVDLPRVNVEMLRLLAESEPGVSVVPEWRGRLQPLCARYEPDALASAAELVAAGERSMAALVDTVEHRRLAEVTWVEVAGADALADVDTPEDLDRLA